MMSDPSFVTVIEVGLRDGLQTESVMLSVEQKLSLIDQLIAAGFKRLQVTSFVNPKRVPQMADAGELCAQLKAAEGIQYSALALNLKGVERAQQTGIRYLDVGISASDTHSQKNTGMTRDSALDEFRKMVSAGRAAGMVVRAGLQCVFGCVYEGCIDPNKIYSLIETYLTIGIDELSLADSTGMANPAQMRRMMKTILPMMDNIPVVLHLHDTRGAGLANLLAALDCGIRFFDTAFGGLGGCPFIKGAAGNIATEDTLNLLEQMGIETGIDLNRVAEVSLTLEKLLGHPLPGKMYRLTQTGLATCHEALP